MEVQQALFLTKSCRLRRAPKTNYATRETRPTHRVKLNQRIKKRLNWSYKMIQVELKLRETPKSQSRKAKCYLTPGRNLSLPRQVIKIRSSWTKGTREIMRLIPTIWQKMRRSMPKLVGPLKVDNKSKKICLSQSIRHPLFPTHFLRLWASRCLPKEIGARDHHTKTLSNLQRLQDL